MADVFISYSHEDKAQARAFADALSAEGLNVWWDAALRSGEPFDDAIEQAIERAKAVVVLWSPRSSTSRWVRAEATLAERKGALVPVVIEPCRRPMAFELLHTSDLSSWSGDTGDPSWQSFIGDIRRLVGGPVDAPDRARAAPPEASHTGEAPTLAVLPFAIRTGHPEDQLFAEGMVDDVIAALAQGVNVRVLASMATLGLREQLAGDFAAIGQRLGVRYLLDGNLRRTGEALRVTTQLVEASSGEVLHVGRFERPLAELASLQEELVLEVAGALDMEVHVRELQRALEKPGELTAWEATRRSMAALREIDPASLAKALEEAQRAVDLAPDYAPGHGQLAAASGVLYAVVGVDDPAEVKRIRKLAQRALHLGRDDPFIAANVAGALNAIGAPAEALPPLQDALRRAPTLGPIHFVLGWTYCLLDRSDEALRHLGIAARLMPAPYMLAHIRDWRANALIRAGRWAEAEAELDETLMLEPDHLLTALQKAAVCWLTQRHAAARELFAIVVAAGLPPRQVRTLLRRTFAGSRLPTELDAELAALDAPA